jgi:hypothetical protein
MLEAILGLVGTMTGVVLWLAFKVGKLNGCVHGIKRDIEKLGERKR